MSGFIPEHYKELTIRVYSKQPHLTARIQVGFRKLLKQLNAKMESSLYAESEEKYPDIPVLSKLAKETAQDPINDYLHNPFLSSPVLPSSAKSRRVSSLFPTISPVKRILEINDGLSIPSSLKNKKPKV